MVIMVADQNTVVYQVESGTYATASGESGLWLGLVTEATPTDNENIITIRNAGTMTRNVDQLINGPKDYEGTVTYHPQDFRFFGYALGSIVDSGSPSPYAHAYIESNSNSGWSYNDAGFPSFTLIDSKDGRTDGANQVRTYNGAKVNSISFTASQNEAVTCELGWIGQELTIGSKITDIPKIYDEDTSRPYIWSDVIFHLPSGTAVVETTEVAFTINNNLERRHYVNGSKVIQDLVPLNRDYEMTVTIDANTNQSPTLYELSQNGTEFNCMIEAVITADSEQGFMIFSGCKISSFESPSPAEGINEFNITITPKTVNINTDDLIEKHNPW